MDAENIVVDYKRKKNLAQLLFRRVIKNAAHRRAALEKINDRRDRGRVRDHALPLWFARC